MSKTKILKIEYEEFFAVLKELEKYTCVLLKKLAKDMPTSFEMDDYHSQNIYVPDAEETKLSELTELLWNSFQKGANDADMVHDEIFINEQIEYFKSRFSDIKSIIDTFGYNENRGWYDLDNPMESFVKLGKASQLKILREGFLDIAISNYDEARKLESSKKHEKYIAEQIEIEEQKKIAKLEKEVRLLDNKQCVYCGREYKYSSFNYLRENDEQLNAASVLLCCNACLRNKEKTLIEPKFGRFLNKF